MRRGKTSAGSCTPWGLLEGVDVCVIRRAPRRVAVLVAVGASQYALGHDVAAEIRVAPG